MTSSLDSAEKSIDSNKQKQAKKDLSSARKEMKKIFSWYKGKFDPSHPDIVALQNRISAVATKITGVKQAPVRNVKSKAPVTNTSTKLDSKVLRKMKTVTDHLDAAEQFISVNSQNQAKQSVKAAKRELKNIFSWYKGKFDPNHPDIVALQNRVDTVFSNLGKRNSSSGKQTSSSTSVKTNSGKLSRNVLYSIKKIDKAFGDIQSQLNKKQYKNAERNLAKARKIYHQMLKKYKNEISTSHSEAKRITKKLNDLDSDLTAQQADKNKLSDVLKHVFAVIDQTLPKLNEAVTETQYAIYKLRDLNIGDISANETVRYINDFREKLDRVAILAPDARELVKTFKLRLSDREKLLRLFPNTYAPANASVGKIDGMIKRLVKELDSQMKTIVETAAARIKSANADISAGTLNSSKKNSIEQYIIGISAPLLDVLKVTYQTKAENPNAFPSSNSQRMQLRKNALQYQKKIVTIAQKVLAVEKAALLQEQKKVAKARFPAEKVQVSSADRSMIVKAFEAEFGKNSLLKFVVYSGWEKRTEAKWINDIWVVNTFNYIGIWSAKKTPSGKYRVYRVNLRRRLQSNGSWGALQHRSVGHSYEILKKNI
ncbi:MAG: hypothetical protein GY786_01550 [Proteobacteria bacterium]|nr:hypothetical protein [Pseudomonadota bacterium]